MTDEKQLTTMEQFSNEILKEVFQELHSDVVDNINTSSVIDRLFCARVLSANDMHDLDLINHRIDKCRRLLIMLHKSKNPRAFVELRRSIDDEMSYDWLVKEIDEKCKFAASAAGAESRVARDHSNPTLTALDADVDDVTGLNRVMDDLRRENGTLMTENRRLKDDIERMSLERSAYEKNMINVVDVLKQKLKQIEKERDDLRRWKDDSLSIRRGNDMFPIVIDERSQIPVHVKKANESESVFIEYNGNDDVVGTGNGAPDRDRDMMTSALGELRRDAWELHVDGAQTPPVLRSPKADRKELPPVGASQHQVVPVGGQPIPTVVFVDETTSTTWSITPDELPSSSAKLLRVIPKGNSVRALTSLGNQLFVIRWPNRQRVEVYNASTFSLESHLVVRGLRGIPHGMASCAANNCLYVSDGSNDFIYRVGLLGNNDVTNWRLDGCPFGLSVNADGNVIVAIRKSAHESRLLEITTNGSLVKEIRLPTDGVIRSPNIDNVHHAIQLGPSACNEFILGYTAYGDTTTRLSSMVCASQEHGVTECCFANSFICGGNRVVSTTPGTAATVNASTCCTHLALDRSGQVIVATDRENNRILVLDRRLTGVRVLNVALDVGLSGPGALYLDMSRYHLYVGECKGGRVLVFDVSSLSPNDIDRVADPGNV